MYVTLWATIFAVVRVLADYSSIGAKGPYPYSAALVTDFLLPVAIGLVFVAVGVAVAYSFGKIRHVRAVAVWCFVIGSFYFAHAVDRCGCLGRAWIDFSRLTPRRDPDRENVALAASSCPARRDSEVTALKVVKTTSADTGSGFRLCRLHRPTLLSNLQIALGHSELHAEWKADG